MDKAQRSDKSRTPKRVEMGGVVAGNAAGYEMIFSAGNRNLQLGKVPGSKVARTAENQRWKPNLLNWPSYAPVRLARGMLDIINQRHEQGQLPPQFHKYVGMKAKTIPTIRSIVMARPGWCIVEADYKTAEMRGLAYISGDQTLIDLIEKDDSNFALVKPEFVPEGVDPGDCVCRLKFPDYITTPADKDKFLMTYAVGGEVKGKFTEDMLQRNPDGTFKGPSQDLHWGVVERAQKTAREVLDKKRDRGAGKVSKRNCSLTVQAVLNNVLNCRKGATPNLQPSPVTSGRFRGQAKAVHPSGWKWDASQVDEEMVRSAGNRNLQLGKVPGSKVARTAEHYRISAPHMALPQHQSRERSSRISAASRPKEPVRHCWTPSRRASLWPPSSSRSWSRSRRRRDTCGQPQAVSATATCSPMISADSVSEIVKEL